MNIATATRRLMLVVLSTACCGMAPAEMHTESEICKTCDQRVVDRPADPVSIPHLRKQGSATQLIVSDQPFIVLGGELGNSTFTSVESMAPVWPRLKAMHLNTVLAPVYWELMEPQEGVFDFKLLDDLIGEARKNDMKLVLLWFASWKNSMSSHVPAWVKTNPKKYPRAKDENGKSQEILTPFSDDNLQADLTAFKALMQHLKETDSREQTVIMVQPENEIGMLPSARDYHPLANKKFGEQVPKTLMQYLNAHKLTLVPEFRAVWEKNGFKTTGTWEAIFGKGVHTDEIFMAWYFAQYTNQITAAGKAVYNLPMFVNAALNRPGKKPGEYPSAGPLPHLMDIWEAGCPAIDMLSPDFYNPDFEQWNDLYVRQGNPLFIPEHRFDNTVAAKALFAIGHYDAIGFSPFSIESKAFPEKEDLGRVYRILDQLMPMITAHQGLHQMEGVLLDKSKPETTFTLGKYTFTVKHSHTLGWEAAAQNDTWEPGAAIFIQTAENEFFIAGSGVVATFKNAENPDLNTGILKNEEGRFENGKWQVLRHLNGDQTHQGRHIRVFQGEYAVQRVALYGYE